MEEEEIKRKRSEMKELTRGAGRKEDTRWSGGRGAEISPNKFFGRTKQRGQTRKGGMKDEGEEEENWMECWKMRKWFFILLMIG